MILLLERERLLESSMRVADHLSYTLCPSRLIVGGRQRGLLFRYDHVPRRSHLHLLICLVTFPPLLRYNTIITLMMIFLINDQYIIVTALLRRILILID